ncbi:hypothetical protein [Desulfovibrio legallii]|jgi:hypothetical protein|uniref:Uncharacterized protein n=1 Tax=Desulfovibrio legallii TaxID=571438 RepID=A0A1G7KJE4_9BACT|nr:hypothetical protein [Desulfovibrio legallii]SDF37256.1 hypothetical protein SAMN05192586_104130 [Desulfovibrio legallii]
MDYAVLNALGITVLAVLALWVFVRAARKEQNRRDQDDKKNL